MLELPEPSDVKAQLKRALHPRTKLGRTTLWFGLVTGFLELLRLITRSPQGSMLSGWTSFIAFVFGTFGVLMVFTGLQLITLGLLAELQARTYHESQDKPIFVVRDVLEAENRE